MQWGPKFFLTFFGNILHLDELIAWPMYGLEPTALSRVGIDYLNQWPVMIIVSANPFYFFLIMFNLITVLDVLVLLNSNIPKGLIGPALNIIF